MTEQSDSEYLRYLANHLYVEARPWKGLAARLRAIADRLEAEDKPTPFEKMSAGEQLAHLGTDAAKWTAAFIGTVRRSKPGMATDWGAMVGWFANAIEAGRTAGLAMSAEDVKSEDPSLDKPIQHAHLVFSTIPESAHPRLHIACDQCQVEWGWCRDSKDSRKWSQSYADRHNRDQHSSPAPSLPALLTECPSSCVNGRRAGIAKTWECYTCHGTGKVLTPAGEQVAAVVEWVRNG